MEPTYWKEGSYPTLKLDKNTTKICENTLPHAYVKNQTTKFLFDWVST